MMVVTVAFFSDRAHSLVAVSPLGAAIDRAVRMMTRRAQMTMTWIWMKTIFWMKMRRVMTGKPMHSRVARVRIQARAKRQTKKMRTRRQKTDCLLKVIMMKRMRKRKRKRKMRKRRGVGV